MDGSLCLLRGLLHTSNRSNGGGSRPSNATNTTSTTASGTFGSRSAGGLEDIIKGLIELSGHLGGCRSYVVLKVKS